jgi:hypothetical protein
MHDQIELHNILAQADNVSLINEDEAKKGNFNWLFDGTATTPDKKRLVDLYLNCARRIEERKILEAEMQRVLVFHANWVEKLEADRASLIADPTGWKFSKTTGKKIFDLMNEWNEIKVLSVMVLSIMMPANYVSA